MKTIVKSISNFRDLGNINSKTNVKIKNGLIFRSAALYTIKEEDKEKFNNLKIDNIIDLRFPQEKIDHPDYSGNSKLTLVSYIKGSNGFDKKETINRLKRTDKNGYLEVYRMFEGIYSGIKDNDAIREVFKAMNNHETFLFHCTGGKDRTGVIAFIIMSLFGYSIEDCYKEYMLTKKYRRKECFKLTLYSLLKCMTKWGRKCLLLASCTPKKELFNLLVSTIYDNYDNVYDFVEKEYGITKEIIEDWKKYYLEK